MDRFARVTHLSTSISMLACLSMALAGFATFGDKTAGNVLNNFPTDNIMVNIARLWVSLPRFTPLISYHPFLPLSVTTLSTPLISHHLSR